MSWKHAALVEEVEGNCPILRRGHASRGSRSQRQQTGARRGRGMLKMSMGARYARQGGRVRVTGDSRRRQVKAGGPMDGGRVGRASSTSVGGMRIQLSGSHRAVRGSSPGKCWKPKRFSSI
jgi:hypothetical protein